jgi:hypothetical protein
MSSNNAKTTSVSFDKGMITALSNKKTELPFRVTLVPEGATGEKDQTVFLGAKTPQLGYDALVAFSNVAACEEYDILEPGLHARTSDNIFVTDAGAAHSGLYQGTLVKFTDKQVKNPGWYGLNLLNGRYVAATPAAEQQANIHDWVEAMFVLKKSIILIWASPQGQPQVPYWIKNMSKAVINTMTLKTVEERRARKAALIQRKQNRKDFSFEVKKEMAITKGSDLKGAIEVIGADGEAFKLNPRTCDPARLAIVNELGEVMQTVAVPTDNDGSLSALKAAVKKDMTISVGKAATF